MNFGLLNRWVNLMSMDIGIDLGTANTVIYVKGKGIVLREPSVVAIHSESREVKAVGSEAKKMLGRTPVKIDAIRPMKDGVIADFEITEIMLKHFIAKVQEKKMWIRPRIVVAVPSGITEVEKRAVKDSAMHAGARQVFTVPEPMAAAIGAGLPVAEPGGNMIIDIGGGTAEIAIISLGGIVWGCSTRVGGDEMDDAIVQYMKRAHNLAIGFPMAERIKMEIGSAYPLEPELSMAVRGRDLAAGLPKEMTITSQEIREALAEPVSMISEKVRITLDRCPPDLAADLVDRGIMMAGGSSQLRGLSKLLSEETGLPVSLADDPLSAVARGTGVILDHLDLIEGNHT